MDHLPAFLSGRPKQLQTRLVPLWTSLVSYSPVLRWWSQWWWGSSCPPTPCTRRSNPCQGSAGMPSPSSRGHPPEIRFFNVVRLLLYIPVCNINLTRWSLTNSRGLRGNLCPSHLCGIVLQQLLHHHQHFLAQVTWHRFLQHDQQAFQNDDCSTSWTNTVRKKTQKDSEIIQIV